MDRVATLLAQFPGPVTLVASKWKWWGIVAAGAVFTAAGLVKISASSSNDWSDWLGVVFFGVMTAGAAVGISLGRFEMTLDGDGFTCRLARRSERWRWEDVDDFAVVEYAGGTRGAALRKRVGFNDKAKATKTISHQLGAGLSSALTGRDRFLPDPYGSSSYGLPMDDLARLMAQWQQRALAGRSADFNAAAHARFER